MTGRARKKCQGHASLQGIGFDSRLLGNPRFCETEEYVSVYSTSKCARRRPDLHEPIDQILEQRFQIERLRHIHAFGLDARAHRGNLGQESRD